MRQTETQPPDVVNVRIVGDRAPAVDVGYSYGFSLYQQVMTAVETSHDMLESTLGGPGVDTLLLRAAAQDLDALRVPLGAFNYFEFALTRASDVDDVRTRLIARADQFATAWSSALSRYEPEYREHRWATDRAALSEAINELVDLLERYQDRLLSTMAERMQMSWSSADLEVTLVPRSYAHGGGYSHPTVVSVTAFRGIRLLEAVLHEFTHVLASSARGKPGTASAFLEAGVIERGGTLAQAFGLFHLLIFHCAGDLVRQFVDPHHVPYAQERRIYASAGARFGVQLDADIFDRAWRPWTEGRCSLEQSMAQVAALVPRPDAEAAVTPSKGRRVQPDRGKN